MRVLYQVSNSSQYSCYKKFIIKKIPCINIIYINIQLIQHFIVSQGCILYVPQGHFVILLRSIIPLYIEDISSSCIQFNVCFDKQKSHLFCLPLSWSITTFIASYISSWFTTRQESSLHELHYLLLFPDKKNIEWQHGIIMCELCATLIVTH